MPDESNIKEISARWRQQPKENSAVNLMQPVNRRIDELTRSTRAEIMMSIGAALFFALVMAWRLPPAQDRIQQLGFAAIFCWSLISVWWLRKRIWPSAPRAD